MKRRRGPRGRFLSKAEQEAEIKKEKERLEKREREIKEIVVSL